MRRLLLIAVASVQTGAALADTTTGNELLYLCQANPSFVTGYVTGVAEAADRDVVVVIAQYSAGPPGGMMKTQADAEAWVARLKAVTKDIRRFCSPEGATRAQTKDVVCKYLQDNPARRHLTGAYLVKE